jgi:cyclase
VLAIGDVIFAGEFTYIDLDRGGSVLGLIDDLDTILRSYPADVRLVPGHGPTLKMDDLRAYREMALRTTDIVRKALAEGKDAAAIKAADLLKDWKKFDGSFKKRDWIDFTVDSLRRAAKK